MKSLDAGRLKYCENLHFLVQTILGIVAQNNNENKKDHFDRLRKQGDDAGRILLTRMKTVPALLNIFTLGVCNRIVERISKTAISNIRHVLGYRESHKYFVLKLFWEAKVQILLIGDYLKSQQILPHKKDILYLTFEEINQILLWWWKKNSNLSISKEISLTGLKNLIEFRASLYKRYKSTYPSSILSSDGEEVDVSASANSSALIQDSNSSNSILKGQGVSKGKYIGFARVILKPQDAELKNGEILVSQFTDPGWTPVFMLANAVVLEVVCDLDFNIFLL